MPFIGKDWRSPGEVWIKTEGRGWEPIKLLRRSHLIRHEASFESGTSVAGSPPSPTAKFASSTSLSSSPGSATSLASSASCSSSSGSESDSDLDGASSPAPRLTESEQAGSPTAVEDFAAASTTEEVATCSVADIIQRLQKSSSQPIPIAILKESSNLIESHQGQPYCRITLNPTKEVAGSNIISDAFYRLDFCNAIRDIRRFAYVSKLLHLLITQNLTSLSGNATKALFWMLEEIAKQVATNKQNIHVIRELLVELREIVDKYLCWGRPLGSTALWEQHLRTMERICELTDAIEITAPQSNSKPGWTDLPEELIREILLRLSDYKDLERCEEACERMNSLLNEERHIWKQLCKYHFAKDQLKWALQTAANTSAAIHNKIYDLESGNTDWEYVFHLLRKKFGLKEEYADCLFLCRYCRCLFWKSKGHPCILENPDLTRQLTTTVSNTVSLTKSEILASFRQKSSEVAAAADASSTSASATPITRLRNNSSPGSSLNTNSGGAAGTISTSAPTSAPAPIAAAVAQPPTINHHHRLLLGPVAVQNNPLFEHPLVLQHRRQEQQQQNMELDNENNNGQQQQQQQQRLPFENILQRFQNGNHLNHHRQQPNEQAIAPPLAAPAEQSSNKENVFQKAPLYVPITPHAFLKFFSL